MRRLLATLGLIWLGWLATPAHAQAVLPPEGRPAGVACAFNTTPPTVTTGQVVWLQCDSTGHLVVSGGAVGLLAPVTGQAIIAVTGTAVQLASNPLFNGVIVKAKSTNSSSCGAVGKSTVTNVYDGTGPGYGLCPGEASSFAVYNSNALYVNGTVGDIFTFEGN